MIRTIDNGLIWREDDEVFKAGQLTFTNQFVRGFVEDKAEEIISNFLYEKKL